MPRSSSLLSGLAAATIFVMAVASAPFAGAQVSYATNRVTSCSIDSNANTLTFLTSSQDNLAMPVVQYLPGADDTTVLVADFQGLLWIGEPRILKAPRSAGIEEVRIGQFQDSPPICRVSISSRIPALFKTVNFKSLPGQLTVRWSPESVSAPVASNQPHVTRKPSLPQPLRVATPPRGKSAIPEEPTSVNGRPIVRPPEEAETAVPLTSYTPRPKLTPVVRALAQTESGTKAKLLAKDDPTLISKKVADDKSKGIFGKLVSQTGKLFNPNDPDSDDGLTKPELKKQQREKPAARIKTKDPKRTVAAEHPMAEQGKVAIKTQFYPEQPAERVTPVVGATDPKPNTTSSQPVVVSAQPSSDQVPAKKQVPELDKDGKPKPKQATDELNLSSDETSVVDNLKIELTGTRKISYKTFRMHDPERLVVDFNQLPELQSMPLPESDSPLFYRLRTGLLPNNPNITRFVVDLPDSSVTSADIYDETEEHTDSVAHQRAKSSEDPRRTDTTGRDTVERS